MPSSEMKVKVAVVLGVTVSGPERRSVSGGVSPISGVYSFSADESSLPPPSIPRQQALIHWADSFAE